MSGNFLICSNNYWLGSIFNLPSLYLLSWHSHASPRVAQRLLSKLNESVKRRSLKSNGNLKKDDVPYLPPLNDSKTDEELITCVSNFCLCQPLLLYILFYTYFFFFFFFMLVGYLIMELSIEGPGRGLFPKLVFETWKNHCFKWMWMTYGKSWILIGER